MVVNMKHFALFVFSLAKFVLATEIDEFVAGNHVFTSKFYSQLSHEAKDNFFFSPFSAETILALAHAAAGDETAEEIQTAVRLPSTKNDIELAFQALDLKSKDEEAFCFKAANRIYVKDNFTLKSEFNTLAKDVFHADLESVNFEKDTAAKINHWVESETENKIHELVSEGDLDDSTIAILVNALYFNGNWSVPFKTFNTEKNAFYETDQVLKVDMMYNSDDTHNFYESASLSAKFLEIPFLGDEVSMVFVLPNERNGLSNLEKQIEQVFGPHIFTHEAVNVSIPKFRIESRVDVRNVLENIGVHKAFTPGVADFRGLTDGPLYISKILQKSFIAVDERGVEAAAATFSEFNLFSASIVTKDSKQFHADHPFIFYVKYKRAVIFAGRVTHPQAD